MGAKKADRWIMASLVVALAAESLLLLWHLGFFPRATGDLTRRSAPAGQIVKSENELRRRSADSLVWEKTATQEQVYYFDSLLTLTQSTAALKLEHETEIELQENTLVTIEPVEETSSGEILLKFTRGNLRARNPFAATSLAGPEFSVELKAGSEMQLRQTNDREFEVQILKGEAAVKGADGMHTVNPAELLRLKAGRGEKLELDAQLRWLNPPPARIYTHVSAGPASLRWEGEATAMHVQKSAMPEVIFKLERGQRSLDLDLGAGDHLIYLREGQKTSKALALQIWKAPLLHLITPLPRDRVRTFEDVSFLWMRTPGVASYGFKMSGRELNLSTELPVNIHQVRFDKEADARWSVWGKDAAGFLIPPLYEYPVFIRHEPLAAPLLNAPRVRKPAQAVDKGAFYQLMNLILPRAHAAEGEVYEAFFSWQPVAGADEYWLEISETADFRNPILSKRTARTQYVWREFRDRVYYWRVAAGQKAGRMGVFSAAAKISVHEGIELRKIEAVQAEPTPAEPVSAPVPVPASAAPLNTAVNSEVLPPAVRRQKPRDYRLLWKPGYGVLQGKSEKGVSASLNGAKLLTVAAETDLFLHDGRWWTLEAKYSSTSFKPKSKTEYPFQRDVKANQMELRFTRVREEGIWGFGVSLGVIPRIERAGPESVRAASKIIGGVHARTRMIFFGAEYQGDFGLNAGEGDYGFSSSHRLLMHLWRERLLLGIGTEGLYLMRGSYNSFSADGFLTLGFEF